MSDRRGPRVIVVGGGTMGLAAAWALARRGCDVELFERFGHIHTHGSHGGYTRIIRHAYHEGSDYVALVSRADHEWTQLAARRQLQLLVRCGMLEFGPEHDPESSWGGACEQFAAARAALQEHAIDHVLLDAKAAHERFGFAVPDGWLACFSPDSGYLRVSACLDAMRDEAEQAGARLRYGARIRELILAGPRPGVLLDDGRVVTADHVVVAAGAWAPNLVGPALGVRPTVLRRILAWTRAAEPVRARLRRMPVWGAFVPEGFFYGFPDNDEGISGFKLACHTSTDPAFASMATPVDPDRVDRVVGDAELEPLRQFLTRYRPDAGPIVESTVCLYTNTPSGDFWIDHHPDDARVVVMAGFSGHGFKFAPVIGLGAAQLVLDGHSGLTLDRFRRTAHAPPA